MDTYHSDEKEIDPVGRMDVDGPFFQLRFWQLLRPGLQQRRGNFVGKIIVNVVVRVLQSNRDASLGRHGGPQHGEPSRRRPSALKVPGGQKDAGRVEQHHTDHRGNEGGGGMPQLAIGEPIVEGHDKRGHLRKGLGPALGPALDVAEDDVPGPGLPGPAAPRPFPPAPAPPPTGLGEVPRDGEVGPVQEQHLGHEEEGRG